MKENEKIKNKKGFTILETALFIALTGIIILGTISSTNYTLSRQRYNNVILEFTDFLGKLYSSQVYTRSIDRGRSNEAVYGQLITFKDTTDGTNKTEITTYNIIGKALAVNNSNIATDPLEALLSTGPTIDLGSKQSYKPTWSGTLKLVTGTGIESLSNKGIYIIAFRSPVSGTIFTYSEIKDRLDIGLPENIFKDSNKPTENLTQQEIDFCVDSDDRRSVIGENYQDIRILKNAHNSSAVILIGVDKEENKCKN